MKRKGRTDNTQEQISPLPRHGILIGSHYHGPRFSLKEHQHPYHSLLYVVSGDGSCRVARRSYRLFPNAAVILKKNQLYQLIDTPGRAMVVFVVYFSDQVARKNRSLLLALLQINRPINIPAHPAQHIRKCLRQMLREQDDEPLMFEEAIGLCLSSIILEVHRAHKNPGPVKQQAAYTSTERVRRVLSYAADRHYESHSLSAAARISHLSQRQFTSLCRRITGKSFVEYINTLRLEKAKVLIINTDMPVSVIAFEVGFEDISTFYRAFRKYYKASPLTFRS